MLFLKSNTMKKPHLGSIIKSSCGKPKEWDDIEEEEKYLTGW